MKSAIYSGLSQLESINIPPVLSSAEITTCEVHSFPFNTCLTFSLLCPKLPSNSPTVLIMAWPTRNTNSSIPEAYPWPYTELDNWRTEYSKRPENLLMTPSPDPSNTTTARPLCNYQFQLPSTPIPFPNILSPTPSSSYLDPSPAKRSINPQSPRSIPQQPPGTVHSPASLYEPACPSPWTDMTVSSPARKEMLQSNERSKESQPKLPCRSRRRTSKKRYVLFLSLSLYFFSLPSCTDTLELVTMIATGLSNVNGEAVNMIVSSRAKEC